MRSCLPPPALLALFTALAAASPYPRDSLRDLGFGYLQLRECSQYCGADNEHCCATDESCFTSAGTAGCSQIQPTATVEVHELRQRDYTTTWTETQTYTSTISSWTGAVATGTCVPEANTGQIQCGPICCANWQYCAYEGQCVANPGSGSGSWIESTMTGIITTQYIAPWRVTDGSTIVMSTTSTATAASETSPSSTTTAAAVGTTNNQLSGGAIAGIVIGTIAGVVLLLLLCFCCIAKGLWEVFAGIFGFGKKKRRKSERVEITEERYSRHGSAYGSARPAHRTWFGGGGGRPSAAGSRKEKKSGGGMGWLAASAGAAALLLGLKRHDKHHHKPSGGSSRPPRSDWSSDYYTDSYTASSPSEFIPTNKVREGPY
ncbi:hypothetical protein F5Y15DRAFT_207257 [Xylariaceae sp. FL0016]|nr:hypothetical protein F5Y15DRAFT_207257 [Xylariaceae sp. FL0016]